jgi:uncharacterized membrane protein YoaT (DUF817 family)
MLPKHVEVRLVDHPMVVCRCRSADYVERFGHHAIDIRAAVAVRCKIVYCAIEAVEVTQKRGRNMPCLYIKRLCFMIELFSLFYC